MPQAIQTRRARDDLDGIWDEIAPHDLAAADRTIDRIVTACGTLAANPMLGQSCRNISPELPDDLRHFPVGVYVVLFRPIEDGVVAYRVLHGRRDIPQVFREEPVNED